MPTSTSHDRAFYVEPERHDGLSSGVPADAGEQQGASQERRAGGTGIQKGDKLVPSMGGRAHKGSARLTHRVATLPVSDKLKRRARFARRKVCSELARNVGGGACGMIASLLAKLGVEDIAMREAALEAGDTDLARRLGESGRMHLMYAREVCAKDAAARPEKPIDLASELERGRR